MEFEDFLVRKESCQLNCFRYKATVRCLGRRMFHRQLLCPQPDIFVVSEA
jgi:hypothetical protein